MKKILILFLIFMACPALAREEEGAAGKYTVIKTNRDYTPVREGASENAKRFSHLIKGTTVFADKDIPDFYRVDLGLDKYYWIEKKYADVSSTAETKELPTIEGLKLYEDEKYYNVKIEIPVLIPYNEIETSTNGLEFILYDTVIDKENLALDGENPGGFEVSKDKFGNLKIVYSSNYPLTGHEVAPVEGGLILKVKKPFQIKDKPLKNLTVVLDPGHGGRDPGACAFNLKEKDLNLQISKHLKDRLQKEGAKVYLTRESDVDINLYKRVDFAKEKEADFLISIHQNSLPNPKNVDKKHGAGVYYYNKEAYPLSVEIQKSLVKKTGFKDDGVNFASFALTRGMNPLCVLVECGYIIHKKEADMLKDKRFQKVVAKGITEGMKNYLKNNF